MLPAIIFFGLSLLGVVFADCGDGGVITVGNINDPITDEDLEGCGTIHGDIVIDPAHVYFMVDGVQEITGSLIAHDNRILKFTRMHNLTKIGGISIRSPQIQPQWILPALEEIGSLEWYNFTWDNQYYRGFEWQMRITALSSLTVENTYIEDFYPTDADADMNDEIYYNSDGLDQLATADNIRIVNNQRMGSVELPVLKTVTESLVVGDNVHYGVNYGRKKRQEDSPLISFPELTSAGNIVIFDDTASRSGPFGKLNLPALTYVSGDFNLTDNRGLAEISVPGLSTVGGNMHIIHNLGVQEIEFPELQKISGNVVMDGGPRPGGYITQDAGFRKVLFPVLDEFSGTFYIKAPGYNFDCSQLDNVRALASDFTCINLIGPETTTSGRISDSPIPTHTLNPSFPTDEPGTTVPPSNPDAANQPDQTSNPGSPSSADETDHTASSASSLTIEPDSTATTSSDVSPTGGLGSDAPDSTSPSRPQETIETSGGHALELTNTWLCCFAALVFSTNKL